MAATSIAARVAEEKGWDKSFFFFFFFFFFFLSFFFFHLLLVIFSGVKLGEEVGYCIQFDDRSSTQTRIKVIFPLFC